MPPPTIILSTLFIMFIMSWIFSDTLASEGVREREGCAGGHPRIHNGGRPELLQMRARPDAPLMPSVAHERGLVHLQ
jgi:hypothetical protein